MKPQSALLLLPWLVVTSRASAEEPTVYHARAGDTCAAIASRFYGDGSRVDLVHQLNTGLGAPPHRLVEGQKLLLPVAPTATALEGPDARVARVRNRVEVHVPERRPAKVEDPLVRGNRVGTEESSAADVRFRDDTEVRLGEKTLVIILGDRRANAQVIASSEAMLVTGSLRARLSELSGRKVVASVETPSASVSTTRGEVKVSVDRADATRLAVHEGGSRLRAQRKEVAVASGWGSKAEVGKPPTPPRLLPAPPRWTDRPPDLVVSSLESVVVEGGVTQGDGKGPAPTVWHVQVATDAQFGDIVADLTAPSTVARFEVRGLTPGAYFARVSGIDSDDFEGRWSDARKTVVGRVALAPTRGRTMSLDVSDVLLCTLDGAPAPPRITRTDDVLLWCAERGADAPRHSVAFAFPAIEESSEDDGAVETVDLMAERPVPRRRRAPPLAEPPRRARLGAFARGGASLRALSQEGGTADVGLGLEVPVARGLLGTGASAVAEYYPRTLLHDTARVVGARLPLRWSPFDPATDGWSPTVSLSGELLHVRTESVSAVSEQGRFVAGWVAAGFAASVGYGLVEAEVGARFAKSLSGTPRSGASPSSAALTLGYRVSF